MPRAKRLIKAHGRRAKAARIRLQGIRTSWGSSTSRISSTSSRPQSGQAILPFFRTAIATEDKSRGGAFDPVTEADRAGEATMRHLIKRSFPTHGIVGEEFGAENADAEYVWVLDPIDGTRAFIAGLPTWGTLIGLTYKRPAGLRHDAPALHRRTLLRRRRQRDLSGPGRRAQAQDAPLRLAQGCGDLHDQPADSSPATSCAPMTGSRASSRLARYGCDCYAYCMLAAGHIDLVVESGLKPYDIAALVPIIEGAGGIVTTWEGGSAAMAGASSLRATAGSMPPPSSCSAANPTAARSRRVARNRIGRSGNEGVEGRPELLADRVALHQDLVPGARDDDGRARP